MRFNIDARFKRPRPQDSKLELDDRFKDVLKKDFYDNAKMDNVGRSRNEELEFMKKQFDYDISSGSDEAIEEDIVQDDLIESVEILDQEDVSMGDSSKRLALVNIDWDHIKAKDVYMLFHSFAEGKGVIESVIVYQSDFGKERMAVEEVEGPPKSIYNAEGDEDNPYNMPELRKYQLERMRYYFCIITCSTIEASEAVFTICDGQELELTSNALDLRYVPDDVNFDSNVKIDECDSIDLKYEPLHFETKTLQHSKIKLTWDKDEVDRQKKVKQLQSGDFENVSELIASCSSGEELDNLKDLTKPESEDEMDTLDISFTPKFNEIEKGYSSSNSSDSNQDVRHFDMRDVIRASKATKISKWKAKKVNKLLKKNKIDKQEANRMLGKIEDKFEVDVKDPRFKDLLENSDYHVDKLNSRYVETKNNKKQFGSQ